jgi:hypothetical protein
MPSMTVTDMTRASSGFLFARTPMAPTAIAHSAMATTLYFSVAARVGTAYGRTRMARIVIAPAMGAR